MGKPSLRSPSGSLIMTKLPRSVKIWTQDGVCRKTIDRDCQVQSVTWLPQGEGELTGRGSGRQIDESGSYNQRSYLSRRTRSFVWCVGLYNNAYLQSLMIHFAGYQRNRTLHVHRAPSLRSHESLAPG